MFKELDFGGGMCENMHLISNCCKISSDFQFLHIVIHVTIFCAHALSSQTAEAELNIEICHLNIVFFKHLLIKKRTNKTHLKPE